MLEHECVATYIPVLHSMFCVSKTPLTGVQRHKSRRQKKTRSLCRLTCAHHIRLSSTALLNTCRLWLRGFLQGLQSSSVSALELQTQLELCCCCWVRRMMKNIVGFFPDHKKGEIHGSSILENQANKQQCMKRKLLSSFSKNTQIPGKLHIKKENKQGEICR